MNGALVEGLSSRTRGRFSLHVHPPYKIPQTDLREIAARDHTGSVVDRPSNTVPGPRFHQCFTLGKQASCFLCYMPFLTPMYLAAGIGCQPYSPPLKTLSKDLLALASIPFQIKL